MSIWVRVVLVLTVVFLLGISSAAAHPGDGYPPCKLHPNYGGEFYGYPDGVFIDGVELTHKFPDPGSLTDAEKYMIAGTESSLWGEGLCPWWELIFVPVSAYYKEYREIPPVYSREIAEAVYANADETEPLWRELEKSPLTGEYPRLDAKEHSPGDMWIHPLTEDEIRRYTEFSPDFGDIYYDHVFYNDHEGCRYNIELISDVFLIRVYGWNGVIYEAIKVSWVRS